MDDARFASSLRRGQLFEGLIRYLDGWQIATTTTDAATPLLRTIWMAGSFVSTKVDPGDIDITPVIDGLAADSVKGQPGSKSIRRLTQNRESIRERYGVEVFPLRWYPVVRPFRARQLVADEFAYASDRGKLDDFWERDRVDGSDIPSKESCNSRRGYLEVRL